MDVMSATAFIFGRLMAMGMYDGDVNIQRDVYVYTPHSLLHPSPTEPVFAIPSQFPLPSPQRDFHRRKLLENRHTLGI